MISAREFDRITGLAEAAGWRVVATHGGCVQMYPPAGTYGRSAGRSPVSTRPEPTSTPLSGPAAFAGSILYFIPPLGRSRQLWALLTAIRETACAVTTAVEGDRMFAGLCAFFAAVWWWIWWQGGGGDDFRRRRRRITEAIREAAGRLVVLPAPAS